jgi:hypothetical protein
MEASSFTIHRLETKSQLSKDIKPVSAHWPWLISKGKDFWLLVAITPAVQSFSGTLTIGPQNSNFKATKLQSLAFWTSAMAFT